MKENMKELDLDVLNDVLGGLLPKCPAGTDRTLTVHPNGSSEDNCE